MKKFTKFVLIVIAICLLTATLFACKKEEPEPQPFTMEISTAADLSAVGGKLGALNGKGVFELKNDITVEGDKWHALGTSVEESFRGTFNGNGHTITYTVNIPEPDERNLDERPLSEVFGLFGYTFDAKFNDLNVVANVKVPADAEITYVGGLAAFMYGNTEIKNVSVSGNIETTMGDIRRTVLDEAGNTTTADYAYEMTQFVGGAAGYVIGSSKLENVNCSANVTVGEYFDSSCRAYSVMAGGVVGCSRTIDLSAFDGNTEYSNAKALSFTGNILAHGRLVNVGGIFGSVYRTHCSLLRTTSESIVSDSYDRNNVGGIAGSIDRTDIKTAISEVNSTKALVSPHSDRESFNAGGLVGYATNFSVIDDCASETELLLGMNTDNYSGGLVGTLNFSTAKNSVAEGALSFYNTQFGRTDGILDINTIKYGINDANTVYYIYNGGLIGKLYGESIIQKLDTSFKAYQGVVGEIANGIEIVKIKTAETTIEKWIEDSAYNAAQIEYTASGAEVDGEQKYRVVHKYNASSDDFTYLSAGSRANADEVALSVSASNGVGTGIAGETNTSVDTQKARITANYADGISAYQG